MSGLIPLLALEQKCDQVLAGINQQLTADGYQVVRTFDLQGARLAHADCPCPHHGTENCTCQMVVLLIYANNGDPATLVIHGQDDTTWLSLASPASPGADHRLEATIRQALKPQSTHAPSPAEMTYEETRSAS